ncbi:molybdate ABC transporter substrate-binding protein [Nocardioides ungokensis]|uniref:molybdate ABC transporter substrate-binding protein n=1 Tax=Nocardioides ungokensis TaxID=1643322 RepID=UPI001C60C101|nr:substrate-binding domain-containing protein [Nocardioides ungokensis]
MKKCLPVLLSVLGLVLPLSACGGGDDSQAGSDKTLTVLAAASLTETFTDLASQFEKEHPGVDVKLAFDSSATLASRRWTEHQPTCSPPPTPRRWTARSPRRRRGRRTSRPTRWCW